MLSLRELSPYGFSGSLGLRSTVGPNSHKQTEGDQESRLPVRSTDVGRFP
jgi:hypothetical protein